MEQSDKSIAWDHAWKHFSIHANQRMSVFNFYLILVGLITAGLVKTFEKDFPFPLLGCVLGAVLTITSFVFWRLDERTRFLIKLSEDAFKELETGFNATHALTGEPKLELKIFTHENIETKQLRRRYRPTTYAGCFQIMFIMFAFLGVVGAILSIRNQLLQSRELGNGAQCMSGSIRANSAGKLVEKVLRQLRKECAT